MKLVANIKSKKYLMIEKSVVVGQFNLEWKAMVITYLTIGGIINEKIVGFI